MVNSIKPKKYSLNDYSHIKVYLVAHSHLDPGWLETLEDYYKRDVKNILLNVIGRLMLDPDKKFVWCETSYLKRFWDDKHVDIKFKNNLWYLL